MAVGRFKRLILGTHLDGTDNGDDTITLDVSPPTEAEVTFTDITTNNASTTKHGYLKKLSNVVGEFMNGVGNWVALNTVAVTSLKKTGSTALVGDVTLSQGANMTLTQVGTDITFAATITGGGAVDSIAVQGDTPMVGNIELAAGTGITLSQDDVDTLTITSGAGGTDGWVNDSANAWTYASASTFTVSGDRTAVFKTGTRLKFTQTTVKYLVVVSSSHAGGTTTVTIAVNTDYVLANAAISANSYSYADCPAGYPGWFNWAAAPTGYSGTPTVIARFSIASGMCFVNILFSGTSNATTLTFTLPVAATGVSYIAQPTYIGDNSANSVNPGFINNNASTTACAVFRTLTLLGWTASGTKTVSGQFHYAI